MKLLLSFPFWKKFFKELEVAPIINTGVVIMFLSAPIMMAPVLEPLNPAYYDLPIVTITERKPNPLG